MYVKQCGKTSILGGDYHGINNAIEHRPNFICPANSITSVYTAVNVSINALSANGMPLTKYAIVGLQCAGYNVSNLGPINVVIPIPSTGSITCKAYAYSFGVYSSRTVSLRQVRVVRPYQSPW